MKQKIPPPEGFVSWLDYAVATMDARGASLEALFDQGESPSPDDLRNAALEELEALRARANRPE
jgi:hypothetical protein